MKTEDLILTLEKAIEAEDNIAKKMLMQYCQNRLITYMEVYGEIQAKDE